MGNQLPDVECRFGSPMGRHEMYDEPRGEAHLFRVVLDNDGYDDGGAYWGTGTPLYCIEGDEFRAFTRAKSRAEALGDLAIRFPLISFRPLDLATDVLPEFLDAYVRAALWSTTGDDEKPLDDDHDVSDLAVETLQEMKQDCEQFIEKAHVLVEDCIERCEDGRWAKPGGPGCTVWEYAGHDFWLTRCGHGCGFWDGDWPDDVEDALTKIAEGFGEPFLYVGDDGRIYQG